jgi:hypothetical protein
VGVVLRREGPAAKSVRNPVAAKAAAQREATSVPYGVAAWRGMPRGRDSR